VGVCLSGSTALAQTPWATTEHVRVALALESPDVEVSGLTEEVRTSSRNCGGRQARKRSSTCRPPYSFVSFGDLLRMRPVAFSASIIHFDATTELRTTTTDDS